MNRVLLGLDPADAHRLYVEAAKKILWRICEDPMITVEIPQRPLTSTEEIAIIDKAQALVVRDLIKATSENGQLRRECEAMRAVLVELRPTLMGWKLDRVKDVLKQVRR